MKKVIKVTVYIVVIVGLLLLGTQFWLSAKVKQLIEKEVSVQTKGAVRVEIGGVSVSLIGKTVKLKEVHVVSDTSFARHNTPLNALDAFVEELVIGGIHFVKRDSGRLVRIRKFEVKSSDIFMTGKMAGKTNDSVLQGKVARLFTRLEVGNISVQAGNIRYDQLQGSDTVSFISEKLALEVNDFSWNVMADTSAQYLSCGMAKISANSFRHMFGERSLLLDIDHFYADSREGVVFVDSVRLLPQYPKEEFALKTRKHADWTEVKTGRIVGLRFDLESLLKYQVLNVDSINVQYAEINSFKNRKIEQKQRVKRLFYESVQQFPLAMNIRKIKLNHVDVVYEELAKHGMFPGRIAFDSLSGEFDQLTNVAKAEVPYYSLTAQGLLMGQGDFQATFRFPVKYPDEHFQVEGRLGRMDMLVLNPMIKPLIKAELKSGTINELKFKISGNAKEAGVEMSFLYDDLVVSVLKEKNNRLKEASFISNMINGVLIRNDNPYKEKTRMATTEVKRDPYRSQFNYLWKSLLSGIEKIVME